MFDHKFINSPAVISTFFTARLDYFFFDAGIFSIFIFI